MKVRLTREAKKQYSKLPDKVKTRVKKKINNLSGEPHSGKLLRGKYEQMFSLRVWPYRVLYLLDRDNSEIIIVTIAHRQGVY